MQQPPPADKSNLYWFGRGAARLVSIPAIILMFAFVGFAGLCRDAGFTLPQTLVMVGTIWALPANVVLVGAILSKASLLTAAISVGLSSIRLMPMVVAILPEMRSDKTRKSTLYFLSHFVAITAWVMALERFKHIPRPARTSYFAGLGLGFVMANLALVALTFKVADQLPPLVSAALIFVTPLYFLFSLWGSARENHSHIAMGLGLAMTPLFHMIVPTADILATGIVAGVMAYGLGEWWQRRSARRVGQ